MVLVVAVVFSTLVFCQYEASVEFVHVVVVVGEQVVVVVVGKQVVLV